MRVAVTGANGRLGRALVTALGDAPFTGPAGPISWTRTEFDLDAPGTIDQLLDRDRPEIVVHAAAWTDVDGCARDPDLALRRNGEATRLLAAAAAARGVDVVFISTNEVFDGRRDHDRGYGPGDHCAPLNAYGRSKHAGEVAASAEYRGQRARLAIVRTSWLYGPPGDDFPTKIIAAAGRATRDGRPLRVVADEFASPTYANDLADAIVDLIANDEVRRIHHVVNAGIASRADWARELFRQIRSDVAIEDVPTSAWTRASTPPAWGVLEPTPLPSGEPMRSWQAALADYVPLLRRQRTEAAAT
jgi:dTDP-4-dehydrorhamnose reductase